MTFQDYKGMAVDATGLAKDALHVHIGLGIFIIVRLLWRWRGGWAAAWLVALGFTLGGEWLDYQLEIAAKATVLVDDHIHDIWNTMLWPTLLLVIGRWLQPRTRQPRQHGMGDDGAALPADPANSADAAGPGQPAPTGGSGQNVEQRFEQA
ncbi:MAG: hypothetical protein ACKOUM_12980 [Sphingopyxis sp.]